MKRIFLSLLLMPLLLDAAFALSYEAMPNTLSIREIPHCSGCAQLTSDELIVGSLYPLSSKKSKGKLTFEFLDEQGQKKASVKYKRHILGGMEFKLFDMNGQLTGYLQHFVSKGNSPGFTILAQDHKTPLVTANKNIFYSHLTLYPKDRREGVMMELSCPFFSWSRDWDMDYMNQTLLISSGVDANLLGAVLALQALTDAPPFETSISRDLTTNEEREPINANTQALLRKIALTRQTLSHDVPMITTEKLEALVKKILDQYQRTHDDKNLMEEEKIARFVDFALDLVNSNDMDSTEKNALLQYMSLQL
ncbi:MAG TPA: hypothetical protein DDY37_01365, partial [Legionella sp.]|nr:hypothetical protein [Legionella sp.]